MTLSATTVLGLIVRLTLLISVILLATRILGRRCPVLIATAQDFVLLGLLVVPILMACGLALPWRVLPIRGEALQRSNDSPPGVLRADNSGIGDHRPRIPVVIERELVGAMSAGPSSLRIAPKPVDRVVSSPSEPRSPITPVEFRRPLLEKFTAWGVVVSLYVTGCLLFLGRIAAGFNRLRKLLAQSSPVDRSEWLLELEPWQRALKLDRPVRLVKSDSVRTPMTFTWRTAVIVIPSELEDRATAEQRSAAILHELVHVQRSDFSWQLLLRIVEAIYWFHPLQWLMSRSTTATRELVCDAVCARHLGATCYANALIELAGRLRRSSLPAVGLAMARTSKLRKRLVRLYRVRPTYRSRPSRVQVAALATMIGVLVVGAGAVSPVAAVSPPEQSVVRKAASESQSDAALKVSGRLIDDRGEPFPEIELKASVAIWFSFASQEKPIFLERAAKTDRDGGFVLESLPRPKPDSRYEFRIRSTRFVPINKTVSSENIVNGTLGELNPSRLVGKGGRVLDPNGNPIAKAVVNVVAVGDKASADGPIPEISNERVETDSGGRFTVNVPAYREYGLMVHSDLGAIARLVVPEGTDALADIQLARGVAVSGRVLARNGQPIANCVVSLKSNDDQALRTELRLGSQGLEINASRITDAEGRFRFSPVLGDFLIHLIPKGEAFRADSEEFRRTVDPPPCVPVMLRLDKPGEKSVTLIEAPTAKVSGTIRSHDGKPASGLSVQLMIPPRGGNAHLNIGETKTDAEGRYSIQAPIPLDDLIVTCNVQFDAGGKRMEVRPANPKVFSTRSAFGMLMIHQFDGDRTGLDGVIVAAGRLADYEAARAEEAIGISPDLLALEREIKIARDAYVKASNTAQSQEQKDLAHDLFPSKDLIARCIELETKHRGSRTAIGAMHWIMRMAAMNSDNPATAARVRLIPVLRNRYVANADVDLLIDEFPHGDTPLEAETLLRKIAAESPHDHVRATAIFELAELLLAQAYLYEAYKDEAYGKDFFATIAMQQSERTKRWMLAQKESVERIRNAYRNRGVKAMTTEAGRLYDQVVTQFPDVRRPDRRWEGPEDIRLVDDDSDRAFRQWTLAERADTKRFQMNNLRLDQPAPILEGTDYYHKRVRLSDFSGKVVVLTVTMGTVGDKEMYRRCSQLMEQFKGQPAVCLSVVPTDGSGGYSVRSIVRESGITWPIIRDTRGDRLAHRWCQQTFPEAYVIDARGLIRFHESGNDSVSAVLANKVKELLNPPVQP